MNFYHIILHLYNYRNGIDIANVYLSVSGWCNVHWHFLQVPIWSVSLRWIRVELLDQLSVKRVLHRMRYS